MATGPINNASNSEPTQTGPFGQQFGVNYMDLNMNNANMANQTGYTDSAHFPPTTSNSSGHPGDYVVVPRSELEGLQANVNYLFHQVSSINSMVLEHDQAGKDAAAFSLKTHGLVLQVDNRVAQLEGKYLTADIPQTVPSNDDDDRSPSPVVHRNGKREERTAGGDRNRTMSGRVSKTNARKQLTVFIPSSYNASVTATGLPTPMSVSATSFSEGAHDAAVGLTTPITPGRIGPQIFPRSQNRLTKRPMRDIHNLDKIMAPAYALIPNLALTDTEVLVFFFQSLARPIVALRLYARSWGPATMVGVLNDHRQSEPPYLRNTCSVKCTTSIKKGKELHGDQWEEIHREQFATADDLKATEMIRLTPDELPNAHDFDIRHLCIGLKKYPEDGVNGGIFTRCVRYAVEHDLAYTTENVWQLARDLCTARTPVAPNPSLYPQVVFGNQGHIIEEVQTEITDST